MLGGSSSSVGVDPVGFDELLVRFQGLDPTLPVLHGLSPEIPNAVRHRHVESEFVLKSNYFFIRRLRCRKIVNPVIIFTLSNLRTQVVAYKIAALHG